MTAYDDMDRSLDSSIPGELFQFSGGVQAYYTSGPERVTFSGVTYEPEHILHGKLEQSEELNKQQLEITIRSSNPVGRLYLYEIPVQTVNVRVYRYIQGISEHRLVWAGQVSRASFSSAEDLCVLTCDPIFSMLRRVGLRRNYQLLCPYTLYQKRCGLNHLDYRTQDRITSISGARIGCAAASGSGTYTGGVLVHSLNYHLIITHASSLLSLASPLRGAAVGDLITVYPGCDKLLSTCSAKFNNKENFGGFPFIPLKNPFTGDSIAS